MIVSCRRCLGAVPMSLVTTGENVLFTSCDAEASPTVSFHVVFNADISILPLSLWLFRFFENPALMQNSFLHSFER